MAGTKAEYNGYTGVWVTSRGRRIFIRDGESITDSILRYNKEKGIKTTRQDIQASKYEYDKNKKHESFLNSPAEDLEEKEYNRLAKDYRDSFDLENEYNKLYENPNYYDEMQGTDRLKAKAMAQPIEDYNPRHEEGYIESQKLQKAMAEGKISSVDWNNAIDNNDTDKINSMLSNNNISNNPIQSMADDRLKEKQGVLENDKIIADYMRKKGLSEFGGMTSDEVQDRIAKNQDYVDTATNKKFDNSVPTNSDDLNRYNAMKESILSYYGEDSGYEGTPEEAFISQMDAVRYGNMSNYDAGKELAKGGNYLIYNDDMKEMLNKYGVANVHDDNVFDKYTDWVGQTSSQMYDEIKNSESDKIQKFQENLDKGIYKDNEKAIEDFAGNDDKLKEKLSDDAEIGFVQEDSMYGGVIKEYTNKELREMAERGIRPRKDSYGHPGAWEGINRDKGLSKKEIAKTVQDAMKKKYPNTKLTRSTSGYADVEITISSSSEPITVSNDDIDKMEFSQFGNLPTSHGFDRWAKENVEGYSKRPMYDINDVRNYAKTILQDEFKGTRVSGDEWYLTDYGKNLVNDIQKELNSYNYDDSNGMVDYFNRGFYDDIQIGKWNKPYENTSYNKSTLTNENDDVSAKVERFKKRKGKK